MGSGFDVVIVGGGSSGCALAARLSEDEACSVLLVEAGPDFPSIDEAPYALRAGYDASLHAYHWAYEGYLTRSQEGPTRVPRGKVIGGSGAVNGAVFFRGLPEDYDSWGSDLWSYEAVLPYLKQVEADLDFDNELHGRSGPVPVRRTPIDQWTHYQSAFREAARSFGLDDKPDLNHPAGSGVGPVPMNALDGMRISAATAYLDPIRARENLTIWGGATVLKVLFKGTRATGARVQRGDDVIDVRADRVVLTAGGIETPNLLVRSGIGPADVARSIAGDVLVALDGVGRNAQDHPCALVDVRLPPELRPLPGGPRFQAFAIYGTDVGTRNDMHVFPSFLLPSDVDPLQVADEPVEVAHIYVILQKADSVGQLTFRTDGGPRIDFRYLESERDRERMREGVRFAAAAGMHAAIGGSDLSVTSSLDSDSELDRWIAGHLTTAKHTSGTCKMGPDAEPSTVVDDRGAVHGVVGLFVADISICPEIVSVPTNHTAMMIGERMADLLRES